MMEQANSEIIENIPGAKKRQRAITQLPVYKDLSLLKNVVFDYLCRCPKKTTKFYDIMLNTITEVKRLVGFANISRVKEDRAWHIQCAKVLLQELIDDFVTLKRCGHIGADELNKIKSVGTSIGKQLQAWLNYTLSEGVDEK